MLRSGPREVIIEVELEAQRSERAGRTPLNVSLVLDRSGSMEGAKLLKAKQAACTAVDHLADDDYFSLVVYSDRAEVLLKPQEVGSRAHRERLKETIENIRCHGSTALYAGVTTGAEQVRAKKNLERVNRVLLLSDGLANVGPQRTPQLAELGRELRRDGISVTTIGLGEDFNEDLMTGLAVASQANYYYVQDVEKLPGIFAEELGQACRRVAREVRLHIEVPGGVELKEILGHPEIPCSKGVAEITLPEVFGAERRLFHLRCTADAGTAERQSMAKLALDYADETNQQRQQAVAEVQVAWTDDAQQAVASVDDSTAQRVGVLRNRLAKEEAVALADQGKGQEAAEVLNAQVLRNVAAPAAQQIPSVTTENSRLKDWAGELQQRGSLGKTSRKAVQFDNYQDKYQKK